MRTFPLLLVVVSAALSGCTVSPDVVTAPQAVDAATGQAAAAHRAAARTNAATLSSLAVSYAAGNGGSMSGFADDLRTFEPSIASSSANLSDTLATFEVVPGTCLYQPLPSGSSYEADC